MNDFIWQYVDIPEKDIVKIQNNALADINSRPFNSTLFQGVDIKTTHLLGLKICHVRLVQVNPKGMIPIHRDGPPGYPPMLAINIPLVNCENAVTEFWKSEINISHALSLENCTKIDEFILTKPILLNVSVLHSVKNYTSDWRKAISIRFEESPWHLCD